MTLFLALTVGMAAAFDTIDHSILLDISEQHLGIKDKALKLWHYCVDYHIYGSDTQIYPLNL